MAKGKSVLGKDNLNRPFIVSGEAYLDLSHAQSAAMELSLSPGVLESEYFLVVDVYSQAHHIHPQGHVGWWQLDLDDRLSVSVNVEKTECGISVTFPNAQGTRDCWENREMISGLDEAVLWLHVVVRRSDNRAIAFEDIVPVYLNSRSLEDAMTFQKNLLEDFTHLRDAARPWYCWQPDVRVCIVTQTFILPDAVSSFVLDVCRLLRRSNIPCSIYASRFDAMLKPAVRPVHEFLVSCRPEDVVLANLSIYDEYFDAVESLACRKGLYYHGITPPKYFRVYDAEFAALCENAYDHLGKSGRFDKIAANSAYSARELKGFAGKNASSDSGSEADILGSVSPERAQTTLVRTLEAIQTALSDTHRPYNARANAEEGLVNEEKLPGELDCITFPPVLAPRVWETIEAEDIQVPETGTMLLYVGRLAPHKKIEDLIALIVEYLKLDPDSHLVIVGNTQFPDYLAYLEYIRETACKDAQITFFRDLTRGRLKTLYTRSSAYVSMSEHEGFCVPLIEAMYFGKPIFAYAQPAIRETLGESGNVFYKKDFAVVAAEMFRVLNNQAEIDHMVDIQNRRFNEISEEADGRAVWRFLEDLVFDDAT